MLSVYTRHHPNCKYAGDKLWRRCNCPKWIWGALQGRFVRQSAKTHSWEQAEENRQKLQEMLTRSDEPLPPLAPTIEHPPKPAPLPDALAPLIPQALNKPRTTVAAA